MSKLHILPIFTLVIVCARQHSWAEPEEAQYKLYNGLSAEETRQVIQRGTEFLVKGQHEDGSFGKYREIGVTSAALHALLLSDGKFRSPDNPATRSALAFLLKHIQPDGRISDSRGYDNYKTSLGVMALNSLSGEEYAKLLKAMAEARTISPEKAAELAKEKVLKSAEKWLSQQQATEANGFERDRDPGYGGQGYGGVPAPDLSNSQFAVEAMYGMGLRRGHPFFTRMEIFLNRTQNLRKVNDLTDKAKFPELQNFEVQDDGGFGYAPMSSKADQKENERGKLVSPSYASITAAGLKCLLQLGATRDDPRIQGALSWLARNYTLEHNAGLEVPGKPAKGSQGLYYFYWTFARAMGQLGEPKLKLPDGQEIAWPGQLAAKLKALQREDGSWTNEQDRWQEGDPYLVTSYCLVALHFCEANLEDTGQEERK